MNIDVCVVTSMYAYGMSLWKAKNINRKKKIMEDDWSMLCCFCLKSVLIRVEKVMMHQPDALILFQALYSM